MAKNLILPDRAYAAMRQGLETILRDFYVMERIILREYDEPLQTYVTEACIVKYVTIFEQFVRHVCSEALDYGPDSLKARVKEIVAGSGNFSISPDDLARIQKTGLRLEIYVQPVRISWIMTAFLIFLPPCIKTSSKKKS